MSQPGAMEAQRGTIDRMMLAAFLLFLVSSYVSIAVNSIALVLMGGLWVCGMILRRRWEVVPTPLDWFFLAYTVAQLLATVFSQNPGQSLEYSKRIALIGLVYFVVSVLRERRLLERSVAILLGSATAVGTLGLLKTILDRTAGPSRLGIFQFYMTTSELMMIAGVFLLAFVLHVRTPAKVRLFALAALVPVLGSLYATVTRGAYLGFAAAALLIVLARNRVLIIVLVVVVLLLIVFSPPYVVDRLKSIADVNHPENASRIMIWSAGVKIFLDYPLFGVGDIDLGNLLRDYAGPGYPGLWGHMHNVALQYLVTLGIVGFLAVAALHIAIAVNEWRAYRETASDWFLGSVTLGALAAFLGLHVHGLTEWTFGDQEAAVLFWTTVGFALASRGIGQGGVPAQVPAGGAR
jgi:O-antigen ligase